MALSVESELSSRYRVWGDRKCHCGCREVLNMYVLQSARKRTMAMIMASSSNCAMIARWLSDDDFAHAVLQAAQGRRAGPGTGAQHLKEEQKKEKKKKKNIVGKDHFKQEEVY